MFTVHWSNQYVRVSDKPFNPKSQVQNIMYKRHHNAGHKKMTEFFNVYVKDQGYNKAYIGDI